MVWPNRAPGAKGAEGPTDTAAWLSVYEPALRRFLRRRMTAADADEMVQNVFLAVHARQSTEPVANPQAYLFRTAHHLIARRRSVEVPTADVDVFADADADDISPERQLIAKEELDRTLAAIRTLPPRAREAFVLHRFEEMTYATIAHRMRISVSAVRQLISRALHQIADDVGRAR